MNRQELDEIGKKLNLNCGGVGGKPGPCPGDLVMVKKQNGTQFRGAYTKTNEVGLMHVEREDNKIGGWYKKRQVKKV